MTKNSTDEISITRIFDAPPELVYRAFIDPDQFCLWFAPDDFYVPCETVEIDARPGGFQRFVLVNASDPTIRNPVDATFTEVIDNELLVGHQDVEGIPGIRGTMRFHQRLEFYQESGGRTRLELRQRPVIERLASDTEAGWETSFLTLDSLLRRSL
jgi:uncharacterized protein YndB with AHSA1/START domain